MQYTGLKLSFNKEKSVSTVTKGQKILPHRVDLIQELMDAGKLDGLDNLFFSFNVPGYITASTREHVVRESKLLDEYLEKLYDIKEEV